jgi:uncharacterized protein
MPIIRASQYKRMPWKNGGGETSEIAVFPEDADTAFFGWRISMARVASDGPFSIFPDVDRTLTILDGNGLELQVKGSAPQLLDEISDPLFFAADTPASAALKGGVVTDLNVMTRRSLFRHEVKRIAVEGDVNLVPSGEICAVFCISGVLDISTRDKSGTLAAHDCVVFPTTTKANLILQGNGRACYITIWAI